MRITAGPFFVNNIKTVRRFEEVLCKSSAIAIELSAIGRIVFTITIMRILHTMLMFNNF